MSATSGAVGQMDLGWASEATSCYWPHLPGNLPTSLQLSSALDLGFSEH